MANGLFGPHNLDANTIAQQLNGVGPGAYTLGNGTIIGFNARYVGRSDNDLAARLNQHVGKYMQFEYGFYPTAAAAFAKECELFHLLTPADNAIHPACPVGSNAKCPTCGA